MNDATTDSGLYLNAFADTADPMDMTQTNEFASLLASAGDLSIPHAPDIAYRSCNVVVRRQRFHFLEWGAPEAPPILLLHGGHQSAHSWDLVSLHLAQKYRIIALDQRGHGDSEWARNGDYSNHTMALDAQAFTQAISLENPIIMGHSMGGRNTLMLTRLDPSYPRALVIVDVGPETMEAGRKTISNFVKKNEIFDDLEHFVRNVREYDPYRSREHIERTVKYNMLQRPDGKFISKCDYRCWRGEIQVSEEDRDKISLDDVSKFELPLPSGFARPSCAARTRTSSTLSAVPSPHSEPPGVAPGADAAKRRALHLFREALPQGQLVTVPKCGHNVHSQNTLGFIDAVGEFLAIASLE